MGWLRPPLVGLLFAAGLGCAPVDDELAAPVAGDAPDAGSGPVDVASSAEVAPEAPRSAPVATPTSEDDASAEAPAALVSDAGTVDGAAWVDGPVAHAVDPADELGWKDEHLQRIEKVQPIILAACRERHLDPNLVNGIIWVESKFNPKARGPAGAQGLMQLMPKTARGISKRIDRPSKPYDPAFNVAAGTWLLRRLLDKADGHVGHALVAYNRGWGYVRGHLDDGEPFAEGVQRYVDRVLVARDAFERSAFGVDPNDYLSPPEDGGEDAPVADEAEP